MAKKPKGAEVNVAVLRAIANAVDGIGRVSQADGVPLSTAGLIEVNTADIVEGNAAARLTDAGKQYLSNVDNPEANKESSGKPMYGIQKIKITIPVSQRGNKKGAGAPSQYNFAEMDVGDWFFVPDADKKGNAAKHLGSTVSQQNMHYREETGETHEVTRTKRGAGNKAELDAQGNKVKETITAPVYRPTRKYVVRVVKSGVDLGGWVAPADGAIVAREV